jgi:hypothetical protein
MSLLRRSNFVLAESTSRNQATLSKRHPSGQDSDRFQRGGSDYQYPSPRSARFLSVNVIGEVRKRQLFRMHVANGRAQTHSH